MGNLDINVTSAKTLHHKFKRLVKSALKPVISFGKRIEEKMVLRVLNRKGAKFDSIKDILELEEHSTIDNLTKIYNRRYLERSFDKEIKRASRNQHPISLLLIDIDYFKKLNDTYGHLTGDDALKEVAQRIIGSIRDTDVGARYGGEEFAVLLPETNLIGALEVAEKVRKSICSKPFIDSQTGKELNISVSIGVRCKEKIELSKDKSKVCDDVKEKESYLIRNADKALYQAKANGRNRVEAFIEDEQSLSYDEIAVAKE